MGTEIAIKEYWRTHVVDFAVATRAGYYASIDNEKNFLISGDKYFEMIAPISDAENISTLQRTAKKENRIQYLVKLVGYINLLYNMKQKKETHIHY